MRNGLKRWVSFAVLILAIAVLGMAVAAAVRVYRTVKVRQPEAHAMQSAGQLIVEHMRLHSGSWPRSWTDLRDTCEVTGTRILSTNADAEIAELMRRVKIDWTADPEHLRHSSLQGDSATVAVVQLRSGARAWFIGAEPNELILDYLRKTTEQGAPHEPPPRAAVPDAPDNRTLDSRPAPVLSGGR